eukprot:m.1662530 g.1662530  ORF g.1662530 m.1662530 type:complete len:68 (+) comp130682_c0_seq1:203-406(+)
MFPVHFYEAAYSNAVFVYCTWGGAGGQQYKNTAHCTSDPRIERYTNIVVLGATGQLVCADRLMKTHW